MKTIFSILCIVCVVAACKKNDYSNVKTNPASNDTTKQKDTTQPVVINPHIDAIVGTYNGTYRDSFSFSRYYNGILDYTNSYNKTYPSTLNVKYTDTKTSKTKFTVSFEHNGTASVYFLEYTGSNKFHVGPPSYGGYILDFYPEKDSVYFYQDTHTTTASAQQNTENEGRWKK